MTIRLDERVPERGFSGPDAALDAWLGWLADGGIEPYPHQEEAFLELFAGNHVVLDTPTGSGKSLVALALHFKAFAEGWRSVYTAPIKALVSEKFFQLCEVFGAENVGMLTGDARVNPDAPVLCCTAEILAKQALREAVDPGALEDVRAVVMDEFHYYADPDRGMAWQVPLLVLERPAFLLMSATLGDTSAIARDLEARTGRAVATVYSADRPVPLEFRYSEDPLHETLARLVREDRAPIYLVHTSQRAAAESAGALMSTDWCSREQKRALSAAIGDFRFDSPFGRAMRRFLRHGVGLHHAGLLPRYRRLVEKLAQQGLLRIICGTDTLGVGINVPIRTVVFTRLCKFDGTEVRHYTAREFKQIAGRAGRKGFDESGLVVAQAPEHVIANRIAAAKAAAKGRKRFSRQGPPARGYKHWTEDTFRQLVARRPEPLESRFRVDHGVLLTLMQGAWEATGDAAGGVAALRRLVERSHESGRSKERLRRQVDELLGDLERAGVVQRSGDGARMILPDGLQRDFSLHHSLSLFLLHAVARLDREAEDWALDVLTLTEAILEDPRPVLVQQAHRARGELIARLKAEGVPYEERMAAVEEVTWPKPRAAWIYGVFNAYAEHHPWVKGEHVRPKSVAREMFEGWWSFEDYVELLGIQRYEGLLLRYLTDVYKALVQNVPADERTDDLLAVIGYLRALLGRVDASLVTEWERMVAGEVPAPAGAPAPPPRPVDISADPRAFRARVRAELHALVRALAHRDWEEAAACVRGDWTPEAIEEALAPYLERWGGVTFDHRARLAEHTHLRKVGPHRWEVSQTLVDPDGDNASSIDGFIDLREDTNPEGPVVELLGFTLDPG